MAIKWEKAAKLTPKEVAAELTRLILFCLFLSGRLTVLRILLYASNEGACMRYVSISQELSQFLQKMFFLYFGVGV